METKDSIQNSALEVILSHYRAGAHISPGMGKTLLGLNYLNKHYTDYCKFLVVAPKISIFQSWTDDAERFNMQYLLSHITFTTYLSLDKQSTDYDCIVLDECHSLTFTVDFWLNNYVGKILGLSGTFPKNKNSEKGKMIQKYCPEVYTYNTDEAIKDDILNDYEIQIHTLELGTNKTILIERGDKSWYTSEQAIYNYWTGRIEEATTPKQLQISRIQRMKAMMSFPSKEVLTKTLMLNITNKCLIFANTIQQSELICNYSYHSQNENSEYNLEQFKKGNIMKLSAVQQLSEGINIPELKECIIMHSFSGNSPKSKQKLSRCLRLNPDDKAIIHLLCYMNSCDFDWVSSVINEFDQSKIIWK